MNFTRKLLLTTGLLACLGGVLLIQNNNALRARSPKQKPVEVAKRARGSQYEATLTHKQSLFAYTLVKNANAYEDWIYLTASTRPFVEVQEQLAILKKKFAAAKKPLIAAQQSLEQQLKGRPTQEQRALLQNDLADVHFALGEALQGAETQERKLLVARRLSVTHYQKAYAIDKLHRSYNAGQDLVGMGWAYYGQSDHLRDVKCWWQAVPLFHRVGAKEREAFTLHCIAFVCLQMEHYKEAIDAGHSSLQIYKSLKKQHEVAAELHDLGGCYANLAYSEEALKNYRAALLIYHDINTPMARGGAARIRISVSGVHMQEGNYKEALNSLNMAVSLYQEVKNGAKENIEAMTPKFGAVYMEMGKYQTAQRYFERALARIRRQGDRPWEARVLCDVGYNKLKQHLDEKALTVFKRCLPMMEKAGMREDAVYALTGMTTAYANLNQPRHAIAYGKQAINILQSIRQENQKLNPKLQRAFLTEHRGLYERVAALLIKQKRYDEAEQVLRFLRQEDVFVFAQPGSELAKKLAGSFEPLPFSETEKAYFDTEGAKQAIIGQGCPESHSWQLALAQQEQVGHGRAALISTFNTEDTFYLLLTTAKERRAFSYPIKKGDFDALSKRLYDELSNPAMNPIPDAQQMYRIVFAGGQLEQALNQAGITTALWFASGTLRFIPIDALHDGHQYLVQKPRANVVITLTSPILFSATTHGPALAASVSQQHTVAADIYGGESIILKPLRGALSEVRSIVNDTAEGGTGPFPGKILADGQFTISNLKQDIARGVSIIHFATHFVNDPLNGQEPFFLLGDGTRLPLSQWERTLHLRGVGLLTLSACKTGVGTLDASGGDVSSIGEVSQYLGAQSVIATLWPVADKPTPYLMRDFYTRFYHAPQLGKVQALRVAQRDLMNSEGTTQPTQSAKDKGGIVQEGEQIEAPRTPSSNHPYAHPYYWAPFSFIGNWT
ncbi:hypothetical protein IAD21_00190 [Abditibacteriota bacterium]|nr:hypothetical protein IAD21_00190 [Abditibacteriota bacterium]